MKHVKSAIEAEGDDALVFLTRTGKPYVRQAEVKRDGKLASVRVDNAVSITFGRWARELGMEGVTFYRLRHTTKTLGKAARDPDALDLVMGHKRPGIGHIYDHEDISLKRLKRVSRAIWHGLFPKPRSPVGKTEGPRMRLVGAA